MGSTLGQGQAAVRAAGADWDYGCNPDGREPSLLTRQPLRAQMQSLLQADSPRAPCVGFFPTLSPFPGLTTWGDSTFCDSDGPHPAPSPPSPGRPVQVASICPAVVFTRAAGSPGARETSLGAPGCPLLLLRGLALTHEM